MTTQPSERVWRLTTNRLDEGLPNWRERIAGYGQVEAVRARASGRTWTDAEAFRALLLSMLSNNTRWERVERVQDQLSTLFDDFDLAKYARHTPDIVASRFVPWFKERKAGGTQLAGSLRALIRAAQKLVERSKPHGCLDAYFRTVFERHGSDAKRLVFAVGAGCAKLDGFGVALAAEAMKNLGYDVAKPDRHVNRAAAKFGWVSFPKWGEPGSFSAPMATSTECLVTMGQLEIWARLVGEPVAFVDNALWLLCAQGGLHLTNDELAALVS